MLCCQTLHWSETTVLDLIKLRMLDWVHCKDSECLIGSSGCQMLLMLHLCPVCGGKEAHRTTRNNTCRDAFRMDMF